MQIISLCLQYFSQPDKRPYSRILHLDFQILEQLIKLNLLVRHHKLSRVVDKLRFYVGTVEVE